MGIAYSEPIDTIKIQFDKMLKDNTIDNDKIDDALISILSNVIKLLKMKKYKMKSDTDASDASDTDASDASDTDASDTDASDTDASDTDASDNESDDSMPPLISDSEEDISDCGYDKSSNTDLQTNVADYTVFKKGNMYKCTCKDFKYRVKNPVIKKEGCKHIKSIK
jgi:hypothetical protein